MTVGRGRCLKISLISLANLAPDLPHLIGNMLEASVLAPSSRKLESSDTYMCFGHNLLVVRYLDTYYNVQQ